ncbi:ATP-binding protein [Marinifilum caeruleilacunae]|uniref:histidine kinase n=1 Tax=Marinifilum caeruleilacunae TaxID=2499076 RepID=A0ABX1WY26_9BACT|nr:ATP-binding protein [Marinifilum caeruleilacunae]NOU60932.1 PAS domain S-box protein [Marinifilum caeruleilacunae]
MNKRTKKNIAPKDISKRFFASLIVIIVIFTSSFWLLYNQQINKLNNQHIEQLRAQVVQSKKDYLKSTIDRTILEIHQLEDYFSNLYTGDSLKQKVQGHIINHIRKTILIDSGYIWVNEIIDYNGGDQYAIRLVHPNLPETEGQFLSTNTSDIKGNKPYLTELQGIKQDGELFFSYWFKEFKSNNVSQKLTYAKLYKKYDWIIATGIHLNDIDSIIASELQNNQLLDNKRNNLTLALVGITLILTVLIAFLYKKRLVNIFNFYTQEVESREKTLQDINDSLEQVIQKRTSQLAESEMRYKSIFRNNQSIMLLIDPTSGQITDANEAAVRFYGYPHHTLTSMLISSINTLPEERIKKALKSTAQSSSVHIFQHKLANGEIKDVEVYSESMILDDKKVLFSIIHDISELRRTKQELLLAKRKAEESDQLKTAFLANMSHEIRTPLNSILGFTDLISNPKNTKDQIQLFSRIINSSGEQLLRIIDDIIDISHIESNQLKISLESVSVNDMLIEIADIFKGRLEAEDNKSVEFRLNIPDKSKDYQMETDVVRFTQICNNLLGNALKFTEEGHIEMGYSIKYDTLEFYVQDTGCGIPDDQAELIFDRFTQVSREEYREGNGLGLSITKGLVYLLGGSMRLTSETDKGSTFYFSLTYTNGIPTKVSCSRESKLN